MLDFDNLEMIEEAGEVEKVVKHLLSGKDIYELTNLSKGKAAKAALILQIAQEYNIQPVVQCVERFLRLRVSEGGVGRKGIHDLLSNKLRMMAGNDMQVEERKSW